MSWNTKNRIHLIYGILLSVVAVAAGACLIVSAYSIYQAGVATGTQPYTYATISAAFSKIAVWVYLFLALMLGGILLNIVLPLEPKRLAPEKNRLLVLQRLQAKTDLAGCSPELRQAIAKQETGRKVHTVISGCLLAIGSGLFLSYACNGDNWVNAAEDPAALTPCMVQAIFAMAICLLPVLTYILFTVFFCRRSLDRQIDLMKQASTASPLPGGKPAPVETNEKAVSIVRYAVLAVAIGFTVFGLCTGGTEDVLAKAAAICTECVGLG